MTEEIEPVELDEPIELSKLISGEAELKIRVKCTEAEEAIEHEKQILSQMVDINPWDGLIQDADEYTEGTPFECIAKKMMNLLPNGKIKKRIIVEGSGEKPLNLSTVMMHYNAYLEYENSPFDSTYARNYTKRFVVNNGDVIPGVNIAVQSMKLNEKSQFLIEPEYAFGSGCLGRIPPNATVLFEIEIIQIINTGDILLYEKLSREKQNEFEEVYKYSSALCESGKNLFGSGNIKGAIKQYNMAVTKLENVILNSPQEQEKHAKLAVRIYSNLLICYTRNKKPRKACANADKIYEMKKSNNIEISAKILFNHAKCMRLLGDYDRARELLQKANKMEGNHPDIINEFLCLEEDKLRIKKTEEALGKALVGG